MKRNFYISSIYTSPPGTMGGNTKIMLEFIDNLVSNYNFIIFTTEPQTFKLNLKNYKKVTVIPIKYPFKKFSYLHHHKEVTYIKDVYDEYFLEHKILMNDYFYSCSDFAPDVLPIYWLKKKYTFNWIATLFLFIPNPIENFVNGYKFPFIKYIVYYFYQRILYRKMLQSADLFLITNDYDKKYFPKRFREKVFAIYGGVNPEQIEAAMRGKKSTLKYDAVFCSRLHPQKGISQLLDIWKDVINEIPNAKLAIIGNGEKEYEKFLKQKAMNLGIENNIEWLGYVNNTNKYKIYLQSKMLLHATVYDNNGMVAAEALCSGLPVVLYDLPQLRDVYTAGCAKVRRGSKKKYVATVTRLLSDEQFYSRIKPSEKVVSNLSSKWRWKNRSSVYFNFLKTYEDRV